MTAIDPKRTLGIKLFFILICNLLVTFACAESSHVEYLGCSWNIPANMKKVGGSDYEFSSDIGDDIFYATFNDKKSSVQPSIYTYIKELEIGDLKVIEYKSSKNAPIEGITVFMISRHNHKGEVLITNYNYKPFLGECS